MKIHKEGFGTIVISTIIAAAIVLLTVLLIMPAFPILGWIVVMAILGLLIFILSFFRIPARDHADDENLVVAPCDGTVVVIE
ncbi:MAG TPA: phosphatidylserine decarboxylase family protein, partial [Flavipsychrobacter sp.]|nr:phosphatidylserine decarboxylase family protein [Flavipsychrobacter sp.]